jgi:D-glycero-alpha-D-manno-heptose 1-phosphate guanylyltransferase
MAMIAGRPFIEWVLSYFRKQGVTRFIISLGHLAEVAYDYFANRAEDGLEIELVRENVPLGTGGAVLFAAKTMPFTKTYIVANADSLLLADLSPSLRLLEKDHVDAVIVGRYMEDASRYGTLTCDITGRLSNFSEKKSGPGLINGGIYLLKSYTMDKLPNFTPMSMENEGFPTLLNAGARLYVTSTDAPFIDIGIPETYNAAGIFIAEYF